MSITNAQIDAIDKQRLEMIFDDVNLGVIKPDSLSVMIAGQYTPVTVDQLTGIVKEWQEGFNISVRAILMDVSPSFIHGALMSGQVGVKVGSSGDAAVGFGNRKTDMRGIAAELLLHEYGVAYTTRTTDWTFWKARAKFDGTEFAYGQGRVKELAVTFTIYPDLDQHIDFQYGCYGDASSVTSESVPVGTWISTSKVAQVPGKHLTAMTILRSEMQDLECFSAYASAGAVTAAVNEAGNIATSDTAFDIDTEAGGTLAVGDYIKIDNEYMRITARSTNTLTVDRGVWGSTIATHNDDAVVTLQSDVAIIRTTNYATWASSVTADVTVGTTYQGSTTSKIGRIAWVSTGSSNITATVNTKASPNLVVTTS